LTSQRHAVQSFVLVLVAVEWTMLLHFSIFSLDKANLQVTDQV
jgi:hypothetical protein